MTEFTMTATVPSGYDETVERVRALLADAGFGVLTEIDIRATLQAKLGVDVPPQVILGACRPQLAHRALEADPRVAALLPCNVVVAAESAGTRVDVLDPGVMSTLSTAPGMAEVAAEARELLAGMMDTLRNDNQRENDDEDRS